MIVGWLIVQAALGALLLGLIGRRIVPGVRALADDEPSILVTWVPLLVVAPLMVFVFDVGRDVMPGGWPALGAPVIVAAVGLGAALWTGDDASRPAPGAALLSWLATGLVLLLLGLAHRMSLVVGQCAFALGAVILWMHAPAPTPGPDPPAPPSDASRRFGVSLLLAMVAAPAMGGAGWMAGAPRAAVAIAAGYAAAAMWRLRRIGASRARLVAGWTATNAVLFGLGLLALRVLVRRFVGAFGDAGLGPEEGTVVASGFERLSYEAVVLVVLPTVVVLGWRLPRESRRVLGMTIVLLGVAGLIVRLATMNVPY